MKILTRDGEQVLSAAELAEYDNTARTQITRAKRAKLIRADKHKAYFETTVRCTLSPEIQKLLRHLVNIRKHDKAYAPEEVDDDFERLHHQINISRELTLPVEFDLKTGRLLIDWPDKV